jgi:GT2 family glycosyltransferase
MGDVSWKLVLADNDSHSATVELTRTMTPEARVVRLHNAGYAAGINAALEATEPGALLLVSNADVRLDAGSGERLVEALRDPGVGLAAPIWAAAGRLVFSIRPDAKVLRALGEALLGGDRAGRLSPFGETVTRIEPYTASADVGWTPGAVMVIAGEYADRVGRWDETMSLYSGETDYCLRAPEAGFRIRNVPDARALHLGGESGGNPMLWTALTVNGVRLFERRRSRLHTAAFRSSVTERSAPRSRQPLDEQGCFESTDSLETAVTAAPANSRLRARLSLRWQRDAVSDAHPSAFAGCEPTSYL